MSNELHNIRETLGLSQQEMATRMGVALRSYSDLERGIATVRQVHVLAAERAALALAVERRDPMLAPVSVRREALELARLIAG